jgi:hypothetical protein
MRREIRFPLIVLIAFAAWGPPGVLVASAADPAAATLALLEVGWKASPTAFDAAREQYDKLQAGAPRDLRLSYAMTLIAIRHHKAREASQFIDAALASKPGNLHLRKVKLWLHVLNKDYKQALAEMPTIAKDVSATAPAMGTAHNDKSSQLLEEHAQLLGTLLAFMQGPATGPIKDGEAATVEKALLKLLPAKAHDAYNSGKTSVENKQSELDEALRDVRTEAMQDGQAKRDEELSQLQEDRAAYKAEADKIRLPYDVQLKQLATVLAELKRTDQKYEVTDAKGKKSNFSSNGNRIKATEADISNLQASLSADLESVSKQDHRAASRMAQLTKQSKRATDKGFEENANSTAIRQQLSALSTYSEFPLEAERKKLVDSFGAK